MADRKSRMSLPDVQAAAKRIRTEAERLLGRIQRDTQALVTRSRREAVSALVEDVRKFQADVRQRTEQALRDLDAGRARIAATLEQQINGLVETVARRMNVASREETVHLRKRVTELERRIDKLGTAPIAPSREEVAALRQRIATLEERLGPRGSEGVGGSL